MPRSHRTAHMCMDMALATILVLPCGSFLLFFQLLILRLLCLIYVAWICCLPEILWTTVTGRFVVSLTSSGPQLLVDSFIGGPSKHQALHEAPAQSETGGVQVQIKKSV